MGKLTRIMDLLLITSDERSPAVDKTIKTCLAQDSLEGVLERRAKDKLGPTAGRKLVTFVDDLNMPKKDLFGSQPPLELLRQWIDYGGWYDRQKQTWRYILDMQLVAAMGPPGGGRSKISERLQTRFNVLNFTFPVESQVRRIFECILAPKLSEFEDEIKPLAPAIVATLARALKYLKARGATILMVEQNFSLAKALGDHVAVMDDGRIIWAGAMAELASDTALQERLMGLKMESA